MGETSPTPEVKKRPVVVRTEGLDKSYEHVAAVQDLNLAIEEGEIFGLIGPNGAGKTTTMRMLVGLLDPTDGRVVVNGHDLEKEPEELRHSVGYLPDFFGVYDDLKVWEYLDFFAAAYDVENPQDRIAEALDVVNLRPKRDSLAKELSRGMKQRLGIARVLLHEPKVLVLDEPASGLDPKARFELRQLLRTLGEQGRTIIVSSHILSEMSDFCTSVGIIERGRLIESGRVEEIANGGKSHKTLAIGVVGDAQAALDVLKALPFVGQAKLDGALVMAEVRGGPEEFAAANEALVRGGVKVASLVERKESIEDIFFRISSGEVS